MGTYLGIEIKVEKIKRKKMNRVFRRRKLKILLRSSKCLESIEFLSDALKKMATKTEKKKIIRV